MTKLSLDSPDIASSFTPAARRPRFVRAAAVLWGCVVFMPVGLNYLGAGLLILAVLLSGGLRERAARLRSDPMRWPILAFVVWTLVVLVFRPHPPETGLSLWHDARIAVTLAITLVLSVEETVWALRGFLIAAAFSVMLIVLAHTVGVPVL